MIRLKNDFYVTLGEWLEVDVGLQSIFAFCNLFNGSIQRRNKYGELLYLQTDEEGNTQITTTVTDKPYYYPDLQLGSDDQQVHEQAALLDQFMLRFEDRYLAAPYKTIGKDDNEVRNKSIGKIGFMVRRFCISNQYKYLNLIDTMYYDYNPIDNYNGVEESSTTRTPDLNYNYGAYEDNNTTISTTTQDLKNDGNNITVEHYTTTYDDDSKSRLENYDVTTGMDSTTIENENTANHGERSNTETGTETTSFKLKKSGNLGITSTQKMIREQREISRFNVLDEFFNELAEYICLSVY